MALPWFVVYEISTGAFKGAGSQIPTSEELAAKGFASKEFAARSVDFDWNPTTLEYDIPKPRIYPTLTPGEFMLLFTAIEHAKILTAAKTSIEVEVLLDRLRAQKTLHHNAVEIVQGIQLLVMIGILTTERANEIHNVNWGA